MLVFGTVSPQPLDGDVWVTPDSGTKEATFMGQRCSMLLDFFMGKTGVKKQLPGDSSRDLLIPDRWRSLNL